MDRPSRFIIRRLSLSGLSVPTAEIEFRRGLNVIAGPSDTGKTFIAQCINFMLGSKESPEPIPESKGYGTVSLEIETIEGEKFVLVRGIDGGLFQLQSAEGAINLEPEHHPEREDSVSRFLLKLTGLPETRKVRTNARGKTRTLSFRDVARLTLVGEEDVIKKRSPIHTGQYTTKTSENAVFRLILTAKDDSSLLAQEEPKVVKTKLQGKQELLNQLLEKNRSDLESLNPKKLAAESIPKELEIIAQSLDSTRDSLLQERDAAKGFEEAREREWENLKKIEVKIRVSEELQLRFELLQTHYSSDLGRLEAISEAGRRLAQLPEARCPICGAEADHHDERHRDSQQRPEEVSVACAAEQEKIRVLARDLAHTVSMNAADIEDLRTQERTHRSRLATAEEALITEMKPKISRLLEQISKAESRRAQLTQLSALFNQRDDLQRLLLETDKPVPKVKKLPSNSMQASEMEAFCEAAEKLLTDWKFPHLGRVTFSENDQDLVINARKRSSHGKGVRALTHAAFTLALLRYCREEKQSHPGIVLIDSPLVVYREPDSSEDGEEYKVKDSFYRGVAEEFAKEQVIILENEEPPGDLTDAHIILFTGADHGRAGFLPRA